MPPAKKVMKLTHWPPPCIIGAFTICIGRRVLGGDAFGELVGRSIGVWPKPPPPRAAKKMSSARHITPLGIPVVPPV